MASLDNSSNWIKIYDTFLVAQANSNKPGTYYPLAGVVIPTPLDNYTIAVSAVTTNARPTWKLGAKVFPIINVVGNDIGLARLNKDYFVPLGETAIIQIAKSSAIRYRVGVAIPSWFIDCYLQVWVYTGTDPTRSTDDRLDAIEQNLERIEAKIDGYSNA